MEDFQTQQRKRYIRIFEFVVVIVVIWIFITIIFRVWSGLHRSAQELRCKSNLKLIAIGLQEYRSDFNNEWPPWLTALYPKYVTAKHVFVCPADPTSGKEGCRPSWMDYQFPNADKDGPTLTEDDEDRFLCSYLYQFSLYPCDDWGDEEVRYIYAWREVSLDNVDQLGDRRDEYPVVRCFHHLPRGLPKEERGAAKPTYNIVYSLVPDIRLLPNSQRVAFGQDTEDEE